MLVTSKLTWVSWVLSCVHERNSTDDEDKSLKSENSFLFIVFFLFTNKKAIPKIEKNAATVPQTIPINCSDVNLTLFWITSNENIVWIIVNE